MKCRALIPSILVFATLGAHATVTVRLDAGQLRGYAASGTPAGMPVGGLLLLIANGGENSFQPAGLDQFVTGDNTIVDAFGMTDAAGLANEVEASISGISLSSSVASGDLLALRWFPGITYSQYETALGTSQTAANDLLGAGQYYGTYSAGLAHPDGGNNWEVPADGSTVDLNFYTTDSTGGGTQAPSEGFASAEIAAIPEPSDLASLTLAASAFALGGMFWRRKR